MSEPSFPPAPPPRPPLPPPGAPGAPLPPPSSTLPPPAPPVPPPAGSPPPRRPTRSSTPPAYFWVALAGAALVVIGAFLPWVTANAAFFGRIETRGVEGDGVVTLVLAGVVAFIALARFRVDDRARSVAIVGIACSLLVLAVAVWDFVDTQRRVRELNDSFEGFGRASVGIGLYLTIAGGVAILIATATAERQAHRHRG